MSPDVALFPPASVVRTSRMTVRVRFAPSPTGMLHIGGVRTALYAWLWARKNQGQFILRIEDTDAERSTEESVNVILDSMRWLGLDWDEGPEVGGDRGPYFQTKRLSLYQEYAEKLINEGKAYRCYATREEIATAREAYEKETGKRGFRFRSPWRDRTDGDPSQPHVVRLKVSLEGETGWKDVVYGDVSYPNSEQQDFVLIRQNGLPLYNFGCFVDDASMGVTLVIRGDDHLINTPPQLMLYAAAGIEPPKFAHLPMVLGPDGKKLSKRHAAVSVLEYRDLGYTPDGLLNYLARLGWSHGDEELFTREQLIEKFDWDGVGKAASKYDTKKLEHVQSHHLRELSNETLAQKVTPHLRARGLEVSSTDPRLPLAIEPVKLRATTFIDLADGLDYFFREVPEQDEKAVRKFLKQDSVPVLEKWIDIIESAEGESFTPDAMKAELVRWMEAQELKMKHVMPPARVALTGRSKSPGVFDIAIVLGKQRSLERLRKGIEQAKAAEA